MMIGTAGHIDHGKTSLVRALTGTDTDRLPEEKKRGMSIELGFAFLEDGKAGPERDARISGKVRIGFIDVPGHEKLLHTMIAGATGIDFALLVVAADDGVMPQTREHLAVLSLLGVRRGIVALTKTDRVDAARVAEATADITALLAPTPLADARIVPVSTVTGAGIDELRHWLVAEARCMAYGGTPMPYMGPCVEPLRDPPAGWKGFWFERKDTEADADEGQASCVADIQEEEPEEAPSEAEEPAADDAGIPRVETSDAFRLAIDRSFSLDGVGSVVTGTVHAGQVQVGDVLEQLPGGPAGLRVRSLHAQNLSTRTAHAGQRCAVNVAGIERHVLQRGHWLVQPDACIVSDRLDVELTLWHEEPRALRSGTRVHVHMGTTSSPAAVAVLDGDVSVPAPDEGTTSAVGDHEGAGEGRAVPEDAGAGRGAGVERGEHAVAGREVSEAAGTPADTLAPGRTGLVQLVLPQPLAAWHGDRLILRDAAGQRIIGGGRVLTSLAPVRYRRTPQRLGLLRVLQRPALVDRLAGLLAVSDEGVDLAQWQRVFGLSSVAVFDALLAGHDMSATGGAAQPEAASAVSAAVHPAETVSPTGAACPAKVAFLAGAVSPAEAVLPTGAAAPAAQTDPLRHRRLSGTFVIGEAAWQRLSASVLQTLAHYHETATEEIGPDAARLRRLARLRLDDAHWRLVLDALAKQGLIALSGAFVHLPEHGTELATRDQTLLERLMPRLMEAGVQGAWVRDLAEAVGEQPAALRPAMARLARGGYIYPVVKDLYITAATAAKLAAIVRRLAQENVSPHGVSASSTPTFASTSTTMSTPAPTGAPAPSSTSGRPDHMPTTGMAEEGQGASRLAPGQPGHGQPVLTVAAFRDASGLGRKRAVQVLEFFDRIGLCRRVGDTHILRTESLLFRE